MFSDTLLNENFVRDSIQKKVKTLWTNFRIEFSVFCSVRKILFVLTYWDLTDKGGFHFKFRKSYRLPKKLQLGAALLHYKINSSYEKPEDKSLWIKVLSFFSISKFKKLFPDKDSQLSISKTKKWGCEGTKMLCDKIICTFEHEKLFLKSRTAVQGAFILTGIIPGIKKNN